jgi:HEAT repeat protein
MRLLEPFRASIADAVLWSLGEIGDPAALPALHAFLETGAMLRESIEACGNIGSDRSIRYLIPILEHALAAERASAARALGMIAVRSGATLDPTLMSALRSALSRAIDRDDDKSVRYHAIIASARLGEPIDPRRVTRALDVQLPATQLDPMAAFFTKRGD